MKFINDVLHSLFHLSGLVFAILLLIAMIQHDNLNGETYFATFHAWISLVVIAGFIVQAGIFFLFIYNYNIFLEHFHYSEFYIPKTHAQSTQQFRSRA
jgi:hypothetical protein